MFGGKNMTLDYAIDIYTDKIIDEEIIDLNDFKSQLSKSDYKSFLEEIEIIKVLFSYNETKKFNKFFEKIDSYMKENIQLKQVANFRSEELVDDEIKEMDRIFDELFDDD